MHIDQCDSDDMFDIYCSPCDHIYLVGSQSLTAFHNTNGPPVARALCPHGHEVTVDFSTPRAQRPVVGFTPVKVPAAA